VLAGGRARRLGGAKAGAPLAGRPLLCHALDAARAAALQAVVVAKPRTVLPDVAERVLREPAEPSHPLCGVLAALDFAAEHGGEAQPVVLLGCDMPFVTAPLLGWLAELPGRAMAELAARPQPLLSRCLAGDRVVLAGSLREERSLSAALGELAPRRLDERELARFGDPRRLCFNVNDHDDLRAAERLLA
jgi:molybdopterin-guanine dinucleotide biosynthesis protein A